MYGMYPNDEQWRINLSFISLGFLGTIGFFATEKLKNEFKDTSKILIKNNDIPKYK